MIDRIKDVIKTGGEWVSSIEVEGLIANVPGVQECAVIGVRDAKWGERPMAFIVCKPGIRLEPGAICERLLELRAPFLTQGYFKRSAASEELWSGG